MPTKIYKAPEAAVTWYNSGGDNDMTSSGLAASTGVQGAMHDFGTASHAREYHWRYFCTFGTAPVPGEAVEVYWKKGSTGGSGIYYDNDVGTGDAAVGSSVLTNLDLLGVVVVTNASTTVKHSAGGSVLIDHRHGAPVIWNGTADALSDGSTQSGFVLMPVPPESQ